MRPAVTLLAALVAGCSQAQEEDRLLRHVPPELVYRRTPLPEHENGLESLERAAELVVEIGEEWRETVRDGEDAETPFPAGEAGEAVGSWIERNGPALEALDGVIRRGKLQFPEWRLDGDGSLLKPCRLLARLSLLNAKRLMASGDLRSARSALVRLLRFGKLVAEGEGGSTDLLFGKGFQGMAAGGMRQLAGLKGIDRETLRDLIVHLADALAAEQAFVADVKITFTSLFLPQLRALRDQGTNEEVIVSVLEGHPRPLDLIETVRLSSRCVEELLQNALAPVPRRRTEVMDGLEKVRKVWPEHPLGRLGLFGLFMKPLPRGEIEEARRALQGVENPLGKLLVIENLGSIRMVGDRVLQARAQLEATRLVLAMRLYRMEKGELPPGLDALVESKALPGLPMGPFSGKPFHYSRERRLLWTAAKGGEDHGGDQLLDLVWRIPRWE